MKRILVAFTLLLFSCADSKDLKLNGRVRTFQPYGWADYQEIKNDSVLYRACIGNAVWSVVGIETIIVPIWLTGYQFYEPVKIKAQFTNQPLNK